MKELQKSIIMCDVCKTQFGYEPHPVVWGNKDAKIMQISQAPSRNVDETQIPFNDASGRKLRHEWYCISDEIFYNPSNFYITSLAHCFPGKTANGGDKLPPKICAQKWLTKELETVDNQIYILLGKRAADYFFPKENFAELVFNDNVINGKKAYVLPHPSPLNVKWFKENPEFLKSRIAVIREDIHAIIGYD